jgi:hypothetical protein
MVDLLICVIHRHPFNEMVKILYLEGAYGSRNSDEAEVDKTL